MLSIDQKQVEIDASRRRKGGDIDQNLEDEASRDQEEIFLVQGSLRSTTPH